MRTRSAALLLAVATLVTACGDDGGTVREIGGGDGGSASGSASASASGSPSAAGSGSTAAACEPVVEGGGTAVAVALDEWSVVPDPTSVAAGAVTFTAENAGEEPHELVVVKAASAGELTVVDGKVDEEALPEGAFIGEIEAFPAGESCEGTFELTAGDYVLFCNIVEEHEGAHESHFDEGMHADFTVS